MAVLQLLPCARSKCKLYALWSTWWCMGNYFPHLTSLKPSHWDCKQIFFKPHGLLILLVWNGTTRVNFSSLRTEQNNSGWKQLWTSCSGVQGNLSLIHQTLQLMWQEVFCITLLVVIITTTIVTDIVIIIIIFIVVIIIIMNVTAQKETKGFICYPEFGQWLASP